MDNINDFQPTILTDSIITDREYKEKIINAAITNTQRYNEIINIYMEDFTGIAEAYKHNAIKTVDEMQEQFRIFLEEYTVNLINLLNDQEKD